jgi:hypothetical protein
MKLEQEASSMIPKVFWAAGAYNIAGALVFSAFFTNTLLTSLDPVVFSWLGLVSIILWGLAYCSVAKSYAAVPWLLLVFFVEKMIYTATWLSWLAKNGSSLPSLFSQSPLTATCFSTYGAGDFAFGLFFLWLAIHCLRKPAGS